MTIKYSGTNQQFRKIVEEIQLEEHWHIVQAAKSGRFRSKDKENRERYPLTAALLDVMVAPFSKKLHIWHHRQCMYALKKGVELDFIDIETEDL